MISGKRAHMNTCNIPIIILSWKYLDKLIKVIDSLKNMESIDIYICDNFSEASIGIRDYILELFSNKKIKGYMFMDENIYFNAWIMALKYFKINNNIVGLFENDRVFIDGCTPKLFKIVEKYIENNYDIFGVCFSPYKSGLSKIEYDIDSISMVGARSVSGSMLVRLEMLMDYINTIGLSIVDCYIERYIVDKVLYVASVEFTEHYRDGYESTKWMNHDIKQISECMFSGSMVE